MPKKRKSKSSIIEEIKPSIETNTKLLANKDEIFPDSRQGTAKKAIKILVDLNQGYIEPNKKERLNLVIAFAKKNKVIYGKAFDIIKIKNSKKINLENPTEVEQNLENITIYEIKSTNKKELKKSFEKYFFGLSVGSLSAPLVLDPRSVRVF